MSATDGAIPEASSVPDFLELVDVERGNQIQRWGIDHDDLHTPAEWSHILLMQLGKTALAIEEATKDGGWLEVQERLIKLAATAMATFAAIDRAVVEQCR